MGITMEINEIYRVVSYDQYQNKAEETHWTTDKQGCEEYIANSPYKHCLRMEHAVLTSKVFKK